LPIKESAVSLDAHLTDEERRMLEEQYGPAFAHSVLAGRHLKVDALETSP
jgi:hypothetical protein